MKTTRPSAVACLPSKIGPIEAEQRLSNCKKKNTASLHPSIHPFLENNNETEEYRDIIDENDMSRACNTLVFLCQRVMRHQREIAPVCK